MEHAAAVAILDSADAGGGLLRRIVAVAFAAARGIATILLCGGLEPFEISLLGGGQEHRDVLSLGEGGGGARGGGRVAAVVVCARLERGPARRTLVAAVELGQRHDLLPSAPRPFGARPRPGHALRDLGGVDGAIELHDAQEIFLRRGERHDEAAPAGVDDDVVVFSRGGGRGRGRGREGDADDDGFPFVGPGKGLGGLGGCCRFRGRRAHCCPRREVEAEAEAGGESKQKGRKKEKML